VGPLALPLLWFNPRFNMVTKIAISIAVCLLTYYLTIVSANYIQGVVDSYRQLMRY
jgi:lipopolysaccharide export LptBFGC system permease protein LptF